MFHSCVLNYAPHQMTSWPTLADHIVHVFQCEVIVFVCCFLFAGFRSPLLPTPVPPFYVELDLCLPVIPLLPPRSPHKSHQAPHQCKGAPRPANGKLLHHLALPSRYCDKHNTRSGWPSSVDRVYIHCIHPYHWFPPFYRVAPSEEPMTVTTTSGCKL